jgi:transcriptional regulator with XRE-family HTH domain
VRDSVKGRAECPSRGNKNMKKIEYYNNKNIIFRQLRTARKNMGLSQAELAARMQTLNINIDQQMISKIENNLRIVTDYELASFCRILSVDEKVLLKDYYA